MPKYIAYMTDGGNSRFDDDRLLNALVEDAERDGWLYVDGTYGLTALQRCHITGIVRLYDK